MLSIIMLIGIVANVYYAFQPDTFLPPWMHVVAAVFCFMGFLRTIDDY